MAGPAAIVLATLAVTRLLGVQGWDIRRVLRLGPASISSSTTKFSFSIFELWQRWSNAAYQIKIFSTEQYRTARILLCLYICQARNGGRFHGPWLKQGL